MAISLCQQLPITAPQCDICSEGQGQPDEIPEEAALNSNSAQRGGAECSDDRQHVHRQ